MRIGLLTTSFPRADDDVAGLFVLGCARALGARGHEVEVLAPEPAEAIEAPRWDRVRVRYVPYLRPRALERTFYGAGVPDNLRRDPAAWLGLLPFTLALAHAARAHGKSWDALVSHWALPCALAAGSVRGERPHLAVMHSADLHLLSRLPLLRRALARRIAASATRFWFVTPSQRELVCGLLPPREREALRKRSHVSPMGIDAQEGGCEREQARARFGLDGFCVLALGRLIPLKGLDLAITALTGTDITLLIAGDGPERARLRALALRSGVNVRFLGTVTGEAKHALLAAADALVVPSRTLSSGRSEGVPTVLLEAMSHGLPIVASDVGGIGELLGARALGMLVPKEDAAALRRAFETLRAEPSATAARAERARAAAAEHHWSTLGQRMETMLEPRV